MNTHKNIIKGVVIVLVIVILGIFWFVTDIKNKTEKRAIDYSQYSVATFAGGCFWCSESDFEKITGVIDAISGYTGGEELNPTYKQVSTGQTTHVEAVQVYYDQNIVTYEQLLKVFWRHADPTDDKGQFADRGEQYATAIFYNTEKEKNLAEQSKQEIQELNKFEESIVTRIIPTREFFIAEEYHQDYYKKNTTHYKLYRKGSGRDGFIKKHWEGELKKAQKLEL